jgi:hypothetical protein
MNMKSIQGGTSDSCVVLTFYVHAVGSCVVLATWE